MICRIIQTLRLWGELNDPKTLRLLAKAESPAGETKSAKDSEIPGSVLSSIQVRIGRFRQISVYTLRELPAAYAGFDDRVVAYAKGRMAGHTKEFMLAALESRRMSPDKIKDADLRSIAAHREPVPVTWLKQQKVGRVYFVKAASGQVVRHWLNDGETPRISPEEQVLEVRRRVDYILSDGDVAWRYSAQFKPDGTLADFAEQGKSDAKDSDPQYRKVIETVESAVEAEMKKSGSFGLFGSCHTFWSLKKEKLKARGIEWRSPSELNPGTCYD